jgi:hypothetical protein
VGRIAELLFDVGAGVARFPTISLKKFSMLERDEPPHHHQWGDASALTALEKVSRPARPANR